MENGQFPELHEWQPEPADCWYSYNDEVVKADYKKVGLIEDSPLSIFLIRKNHYKERMADVIQHTNYFLKFYDIEKELFMSVLSVKFITDSNKALSQKAFIALVLDRIITASFIGKCKKMSCDLYTININTDSEGKFRNSPKITNAQARQIVAVSFAYRLILPLCIHYTNVSLDVGPKTAYLACFDKLFVRIMERFEENDVHIYTALCKFAKFRVDKEHNNNKIIWHQKKQLRGDTPELYLENIIHEVIIVKTIYKLDHRKSCVAFLDGVIHNYSINYRKENYVSKPYEIDSQESGSDSDEYLSHSEALEMASYKIDESNILINDVNITNVLKHIDRKFASLPITDEELAFYYEEIKINQITQFMLHAFYTRFFHDAYAVYSINRPATIKLLLYLKKFLQLSKMPILAQVVTAKIQGKYKDSMIKNARFVERMSSSSVYESIIKAKYQYVKEIDTKDDPIIKKLSGIINSTFEFVDIDSAIHGYVYTDVDVDEVVNEFMLFLSII